MTDTGHQSWISSWTPWHHHRSFFRAWLAAAVCGFQLRIREDFSTVCSLKHQLDYGSRLSKAKELFEDEHFFFWSHHKPAVQNFSTGKLQRTKALLSLVVGKHPSCTAFNQLITVNLKWCFESTWGEVPTGTKSQKACLAGWTYF